jgi:hypothetical protein
MTKLHRTIMRRVYYSYALSFFTQTVFRQGVVLGAAVIMFGQLTHVASIMNNFLATPLSNVPNFILDAFVHALSEGRLLTVLVVIMMVLLSVSISLRFLNSITKPHRQYRSV